MRDANVLVGAVSCTGPRPQAPGKTVDGLPRVANVCARIDALVSSGRRLRARAGTGHGPYEDVRITHHASRITHHAPAFFTSSQAASAAWASTQDSAQTETELSTGSSDSP